jgi:hypothetical protein
VPFLRVYLDRHALKLTEDDDEKGGGGRFGL